MTDTRRVKGCCPLDCQDTCAWEAVVEDGRVTRVVGAADHPFTRGTLCAKVNDYQARTYAPDRLLYPLRRSGPKGSGQFERTSWDDALDTIAGRFRAIIDEHGGEALLPVNYLGSMGILQRRALLRIFHALGASRFHGSICGAAGNILDAEGHPRSFDPEEIADSRYVLLWGANLLTTSHHQFHFIREARERHGARLVMIDPRRTITARACDEHISIRPGSDAVMAAGLAHVILAEGLADLDYAGRAALDLEAFREQVTPWTPERTAAACGLESPEAVTRLAREFAAARPATIRCGVAPQQTVGGEEFIRMLSALTILCGHWQHRGGGLFLETYPVLDETRAFRRDLIKGTPRSLDMARLGEHLTSPDLSPPIKAFIVWTMNPAVDQPDAEQMRRGMMREDLFTVVIENFMTDTARLADIVLPSTTQLEHFDVQGAWGHEYISANNPAMAPLGEARSHADIMRDLAPRLGLVGPAFQESDETIVAATLPDGLTVAALRAAGWYKSPRPRPNPAAGPGRLKLAGGIPEPPAAPPGHFHLLTPKSHYFLNSSFANMPRQRTAMKRPTLEMNECDAAARSLHDGQKVLVVNERGKLTAWLALSADIHPGVVALPGKWWSLPDATGAMANRLTPSSWTPGGQPAYNDTFVRIEPASEGE